MFGPILTASPSSVTRREETWPPRLPRLPRTPTRDLPQPKLVAALMPGEVFPSREPSLDRIPASTLLLVAVGEDDLLVGDLRGRQIFAQAGAIPRSTEAISCSFDPTGTAFRRLIAEHTAPTGANRRLDTGEGVFRSFQLSLSEVNALDRAGFWRIADVAIETAFAGHTFDEAIRDPDRFTHLGFWSDGRKVIPPLISDNLSSIPRVNLPNGIRVIPWDVTVIKLNEAARIDTDTRDPLKRCRNCRAKVSEAGSSRPTCQILKLAPFPRTLKMRQPVTK